MIKRLLAALYLRYSTENQRPASIADQIVACRRSAQDRGFVVLDEHIYADEAQSGARWDRPALQRMLAAAREHLFDVLLVDDLSRLARDNYFMLGLVLDLKCEGIRLVSVADGVDTADPHATLNLQLRGLFNELHLSESEGKDPAGPERVASTMATSSAKPPSAIARFP